LGTALVWSESFQTPMGDRQQQTLGDFLARSSVDSDEPGTQRLVSAHYFIEAALERRQVEPAAHTDR